MQRSGKEKKDSERNSTNGRAQVLKLRWEFFFQRGINLSPNEGGFFGVQNKWRGQKNVIAAQAIDTALRGVGEHVFLQSSLADAFGNILRRRKWFGGHFVSHEFYAD